MRTDEHGPGPFRSRLPLALAVCLLIAPPLAAQQPPAAEPAGNVLIAPDGAGWADGIQPDTPIGTNAKGVPVPLPDLGASPEEASIVIDAEGAPIDGSTLLQLPFSEAAPDIAADVPPAQGVAANPPRPGGDALRDAADLSVPIDVQR